MIIETKIKKTLKKAIKSLKLSIPNITLEFSSLLEYGDYSSNIALTYAKILNLNPFNVALKIVKEIEKQKNNKEIKKIEVKNGFINFFLSKKFFEDSLRKIIREKEKFGSHIFGKRKKVIIEYSSPNIAKPFTIGHLRSTIIGDSLARIFSFCGYQVIRDNHLGDWGTQFGQLIVALKKWGDIERLKRKKITLDDLVNLYIKFHQESQKDVQLEEEARFWFSELEKGNKEALKIWKVCRDISLKELERIYRELNVKFNIYTPESFFKDKTKEVIKILKRKKLITEEGNVLLVRFPLETNLPPLLLTKSDGSSLYALRDLATDFYRKKKFNPFLIINEVGSEQSLFFRQLFTLEEMMGLFKKGQRIHKAHGLYCLKNQKISTREGNVIWLKDVLEEGYKKASQFNPKVAKEVAIGAIKFNDLKRESIKDINFDWNDILNLEGDTGPYLQYTYARICSLLKKAKKEKVKVSFQNKEENIYEIERLLYRFPEIVRKSALELSPHYLANYLLEIAKSFNSFYGLCKIIDKNSPYCGYRLAISKATKIILENGLNLLGIKPLQKM